MVLKEIAMWLNFDPIYYTMVLKGNGLERSCHVQNC